VEDTLKKWTPMATVGSIGPAGQAADLRFWQVKERDRLGWRGSLST
jgi:hypothetical protein